MLVSANVPSGHGACEQSCRREAVRTSAALLREQAVERKVVDGQAGGQEEVGEVRALFRNAGDGLGGDVRAAVQIDADDHEEEESVDTA